jgi:hypothetical protein
MAAANGNLKKENKKEGKSLFRTLNLLGIFC